MALSLLKGKLFPSSPPSRYLLLARQMYIYILVKKAHIFPSLQFFPPHELRDICMRKKFTLWTRYRQRVRKCNLNYWETIELCHWHGGSGKKMKNYSLFVAFLVFLFVFMLSSRCWAKGSEKSRRVYLWLLIEVFRAARRFCQQQKLIIQVNSSSAGINKFASLERKISAHTSALTRLFFKRQTD